MCFLKTHVHESDSEQRRKVGSPSFPKREGSPTFVRQEVAGTVDNHQSGVDSGVRGVSTPIGCLSNLRSSPPDDLQSGLGARLICFGKTGRSRLKVVGNDLRSSRGPGGVQETGLAPNYLELELIESLLLANADVTLSVIQGLKAMGLAVAIDDFGTGYSSFSYLRQFRVSKLKIDRSFIRDVAVNPDDAAITSAIIRMAKSLKLKVIAEGVEDETQMSFLRAHQCDEIQGYYFSRPLIVEKVADKLRAGNTDLQVRAQASVGQS